MTTLPAPRSKGELLARARQEARLSLGRAAFVRDARVLPLGVPIALGVAAVVYSRAARRPRGWRALARRSRPEPLTAAGAALVGALAVSYAAARVEWDLRRRAWRTLHEAGD